MISLSNRLASHGILLIINKKRIKNINFRIKAGQFVVSTPIHISQALLAQAIEQRIDWAIQGHERILAQGQQPTRLWGEPFDARAWLAMQQDNLHTRSYRRLQAMPDDELIAWIYRQQVAQKLPELLQKWQPKVGKFASTVSIKAMKSRWGSCNTRTAKITINSRLAAYPVECLSYVLVHELCHLYHANHSAEFWACVASFMPEYRLWHDRLKG